MAHYTFEIFKYKWITDKDGDTYRDYIDEMPHFIVEAENYIEATFKAQKKYPSDNSGDFPLLSNTHVPESY